MSNGITIIAMLAIAVVMLAVVLRMFLKARQPGWAAFVPH